MQTTIEDFWEPYNQLLKSFELRDQNSILLTNLFTKVKTTYENIATWFRTLGESFHKDLLKDSSNEQSYTYYQYLGNYLLKVSEVNKEFSKNIQNNILVPYVESSKQIDSKTRENLDKINKALTNIESSKNILKKHQESYYKLSKNADKTQHDFEKLIEANKPEEQIMKGQEKLMKIKMDAQEAANLYRQQLKTTNQNLEVLYATYEPIFELYDELELQKTNRTKDAIVNLVKEFNVFYTPVEKQFQDNPEDRFKELQEKVIVKPNNLQLLTNGRLDEVFKTKPMEEYLSYEAKKKIDELTLIKSVENDEYTVIYSASNENDLQFIIDFTKLFQSNRSISLTNELNIEAHKDDHNESSISLDSTGTRERSMSDSQCLLKIPLTNDEEKKIMEIIKNPVNRRFLLENLYKSQEIFKDSETIIISLKSYKYLKSFLWKVLEIIMEEKDFDNLSTFLNVIFRYSTKRGGEILNLSEHFRGQKMWKNIELWKDIVKNFYEKKANEEAEKQKKIQESEKLTKSFAPAPFMDKIINYGYDLQRLLEKTKSKENTLSENDIFNIYFSLLRDVAFYLAKLIDKMSVASEILITIASDLGFESQEIEDLILVIKRERNMVLRGEAEQHLVKKQQRGPKKWGKHYPIYLSLDYLEPKDLMNVLQLNHQISSLFRKKVYRTLFYNFGHKLNIAQRFKIWSNILETNKVNIDFRTYLKEYEKSDNANLKQAEEVIHIDVVRSFKKHGEYNQEELKDLLKGYAAYDKESSYCQGMNYMMGFFYLHTQNPDISFQYFTRLMQKHMHTMFDKDFKQLRNYFFKLNRMVEIYIPDLADHFSNEKIDSSFYAPSWFITAFSSTFQYSPKSKLLEKIWDYFILDGVKAIFKVTLLILKEYKSEIMNLRFDNALNYINDLGKQELFTNIKYLEIKEGKASIQEAPKEYKFIEEFEVMMKEMHLSMELLNSFDDDLEVFEKKIPKLAKSPEKNKEK